MPPTDGVVGGGRDPATHEATENDDDPGAGRGRRGADDRDRTGDLNLGKVALYQLSHIRRTDETSAYVTPRNLASATSSLRFRTQIDPQGQHAVDEFGVGVTDDREVLEVVPGLLDERLAAFALDGRQRTLLHGDRTIAESLDH